MALLALASFHASGPAYPIPNAGPIMNAWNWYLNGGNVSVHYFVMTFGCAIALVVRIYHWRAAAIGNNGYESLEMEQLC